LRNPITLHANGLGLKDRKHEKMNGDLARSKLHPAPECKEEPSTDESRVKTVNIMWYESTQIQMATQDHVHMQWVIPSHHSSGKCQKSTPGCVIGDKIAKI
jgi:hypothetical protein